MRWPEDWLRCSNNGQKKHVKEFDEKKLHVSLTKDQIKDKFEVDKDGKAVNRRYTPGE
jgi:hypothetical protein